MWAPQPAAVSQRRIQVLHPRPSSLKGRVDGKQERLVPPEAAQGQSGLHSFPRAVLLGVCLLQPLGCSPQQLGL